MLVELSDDDELRKLFIFNDMYCLVYFSLNTEVEVSVEVIPEIRYINLHSIFIPAYDKKLLKLVVVS